MAARDLATLAGIAGLLAASTLAERYPVPPVRRPGRGREP